MSTEDPREARRTVRGAALHLITGTVVSQVVQFGGSLLIARLISPTEFGQFAAALGVASMLGVLIALSYPTAIPLAKDDREAQVVTWLSVAVATLLTLPVLILLVGLAWTQTSVLGYPIEWWFAIFVPLGAVSIAIFMTMQMRLSRLGEFQQIGRATASGAVVQVVSQISMGFAGLGATGLAAGYLAGRLVNIALLATKCKIGSRPSLSTLAAAGRNWSARTRWLVLTSVMNLLATSALTPWVLLQYGPAVAGAFALAFQTLSVPAAVIGQAVGTILFPKLAEAKREGILDSTQVEKYIKGLATLAFPVFLPVLILGPELYALVFGEEWKLAGVIAAILAPWLGVAFVTSPLSSLVLVLGKFWQTTAVAAADTILRLGAIALGAYLGSVTLGFLLYTVVGMAVYLSYMIWIMRLIGGSLLVTVRSGWLSLVGSGLLVVFLLALQGFVSLQALAIMTALTSSFGFWLAFRTLRR